MHSSGYVADGFEAVAEAFERNFEELGDSGAAVCVFSGAAEVVDLVGGHADPSTGRPWDERTIALTYSTTKPFAAACAVLLADRQEIDLDRPVSDHWPEFKGDGKESLSVRGLLTHQAGLISLEEDVPTSALFEPGQIVELLERATPRWKPGSAHGEHAYFYGHLIGELVRRVDGRTLGTFFAEEIARPWELDFHIGVSAEDLGRVAPLEFDEEWLAEVRGEPGSETERALGNPPGMLEPEVVLSTAWLTAEIPAVNGVGTAKAVARFYEGLLAGGTLDGVRLLSKEACDDMLTVHSSGHDAFLDRHVDWGLGVQVDEDGAGHGGLGGSLGLCDPDRGVAFGYVTRTMSDSPRADALWDAVLRCL